MQWVNLLFAGLLALLPSPIKIPIYRRLYGFTIGKGVRLGVSPFIGVNGRAQSATAYRSGTATCFMPFRSYGSSIKRGSVF